MSNYLAVPDKRYSFDIARVESGLHDVFDAYLRQARVPLPRAVADFLAGFREVNTRAAWLGHLAVEELSPRHQPAVALDAAARVYVTGVYLDTHCWVFTPYSFARLMKQLVLADLLRFACADFTDTALFEPEFFVGLRATSDREEAAQSWRRMQQAVRRDVGPAVEIDDGAGERAASAGARLGEGAVARALARAADAEHDAAQSELRANQAEGALNDARAQAADLAAQLAGVARELSTVTNSRTWRATAPARVALSTIRWGMRSRRR